MRPRSSALQRFINPRSVAVFGGGWAVNVIEQLRKSDYQGQIWPVHPSRRELAGIACFNSIDDLPTAPDAAFLGVNRQASIPLLARLSSEGAGGAICFASGFSESSQQGEALQKQLLAAAGSMPLLGPNCYGYLNYLDNVWLWPDQHGGQRVSSGVAIIAQSSNVAINMTMQRRGLPITHVFTVGNQVQMGISELATELLSDARVTAIGLYVEGFDDIRSFEAMAAAARLAGKAVVVLKIGKSIKGQQSSLTHTAALTGSAKVSSAFFRRLGLVEVNTVSEFLATLKLADSIGAIGPDVVSISCSGGEASLMADMAEGTAINYRDFSFDTGHELRKILSDKVAIANPFDYHTYIWGDEAKMVGCFTEVLRDAFDLSVFVLDIPRSDRCDSQGYQCAINAIIAARCATEASVAVISVLAENLPDAVMQQFDDAGIATLHGMEAGIAAIDAMIRFKKLASQSAHDYPVLLSIPKADEPLHIVEEFVAKQRLSRFGIAVPRGCLLQEPRQKLDEQMSAPYALKVSGMAHKTEAGGVLLDIPDESALRAAIERMPPSDSGYLVEEMVEDAVAELLIGVTIDPTGLLAMTIGAGGVKAELWNDSVTLILPARREQIADEICALRVAKLLNGFRGQQAANIDLLIDTILAVGEFASAHIETLVELDINPLIVGSSSVVAVDALLLKRDAG